MVVDPPPPPTKKRLWKYPIKYYSRMGDSSWTKKLMGTITLHSLCHLTPPPPNDPYGTKVGDGAKQLGQLTSELMVAITTDPITP